MMTLNFSIFMQIFSSIFIALILSIIPLTPAITLFYPLWVPLLIIYWVMLFPEHIHFSFVFIIGLILDILHGTYMGMHCFALCVVTFLVRHFYLRCRMCPMIQQMLFVFSFLSIYVVLFVFIEMFFGKTIKLHWLWISILVSTLIWPLLKKVLKVRNLGLQHR